MHSILLASYVYVCVYVCMYVCMYVCCMQWMYAFGLLGT